MLLESLLQRVKRQSLKIHSPKVCKPKYKPVDPVELDRCFGELLSDVNKLLEISKELWEDANE